MEKWHNGPNGPGICRAKPGNCPFGDSESHYNSKSEAEKAYKKEKEGEYGILPKSTENNFPVFINSWNENMIPVSEKSFLSVEGKDVGYFKEKIEEANMDAQKMVDLLNNDNNIKGVWEVKEEKENNITLKTKNSFGNVRFVNVEKQADQKEENIKGLIVSHKDNMVPTSLANYVSLGSGGTKESQEYFEKLVKESNLDAKNLVKTLNSDKRIHGEWSLDSETSEWIKIKTKDSMGNVDFINISK